ATLAPPSGLCVKELTRTSSSSVASIAPVRARHACTIASGSSRARSLIELNIVALQMETNSRDCRRPPAAIRAVCERSGRGRTRSDALFGGGRSRGHPAPSERRALPPEARDRARRQRGSPFG